MRNNETDMEVNDEKSKMAGNGKYIKIPEKYVICVLTVCASCVCYLNSLNGDFVHDDLYAIQNNGDVNGRNPTWSFLKNDFWGKSIADPRSHKSYRPVTVLSFR